MIKVALPGCKIVICPESNLGWEGKNNINNNIFQQFDMKMNLKEEKYLVLYL
jgi:hypothetical protein